MSKFQSNPVKLYIQDIYRAERSSENKYIYSLFGLSFKNISIHGVITSVYNTLSRCTNFEITDPTGSIQVYYDSTKSNTNISDTGNSNLKWSFNNALACGSDNIAILRTLQNAVSEKRTTVMDINEGDYFSVIGDVFLDSTKNSRMVSAYQCHKTTAERDIVWLDELKYLYDNYYIKYFESYL